MKVQATFHGAPCTLMADAAGDGQPVWVQLAKQGKFLGHPAGPFEMTLRTFEEIVRNFKAHPEHVPFDFEHACESDPSSGSIPTHGAPAQGWIVDLKIDDGKLFGLVEWGELARQYIREGKYKYVSPAVRLGAKDRVTGKPCGARLTSAALTNAPFLSGMQQVAAKDASEPPLPVADDWSGADDGRVLFGYVHRAEDFMPAIKAALKLPELATPKEVHEHLLRLEAHHGEAAGASHVHGVPVADYVRDLSAAMRTPLGTRADDMFKTAKRLVRSTMTTAPVEPEPAPAAVATATNEGAEVVASDTERENMDQNAKLLSDAQASVSELTLKLRASDAENDKLKTENKQLRDRIEAVETQALEAEVDEAILVYADTKGVTAKDRPHLLSFAKANIDGFRALYPRVQPGQEHLQRRLTTDGPANARGAVQTGPITLADRTRQLMEERKLSFAAAQSEASKEFRHLFVKGGR